MKVEFLVALMDHTWYTKVVDIPDELLPQTIAGHPNPHDEIFDHEAAGWAMGNLREFQGDIALVTVYCSDPPE